MTATRATLPEQASRTELVSVVNEDIAEVATFVASQSGRSAEKVDAHLRWFLLENPALQPQHPLGFGLRSSGQLIGCILCSPQAFCFRGERILMMGSSMFYVHPHHRGHGGRIFLQYSRLGKQWPLFGTSANSEAAALWRSAGANAIPHSDAELFGILRCAPVLEEFAHRRNVNGPISRLMGSSIAKLAGLFASLKIDCGTPQALQPLTSAEQVNDFLIPHPSAKLTAMRDTAYIRWRYFSGRDATVTVFAFRSRKPDREILIAVNQRIRGYRSQIKTLNVLDVYPEVSSEEWARIVGALIVRYCESVDAIVLRNQNLEGQKIFCERGFRRRMFSAPNGWFLDKSNILPTRDWYLVPADGDGLI